MEISAKIKAALSNGKYSEKNGRIDYKEITGAWSMITRHSVLSSEELDALTTKFGADVIEQIGLRANDERAEQRDAESAARVKAAAEADMAKGRIYRRDRDFDGEGFLEGLRNCVGL